MNQGDRGGLPRRCFAIVAVAALMAACATLPPPAVLSPDDRVAVGQITDYLNNLHSFQARFTQLGPDGLSQGEVWLSRPGRLAVEYEQPHPRAMIANRGRLLLADRVTGAITTLPVSRTPLDILLAPAIELTNTVTITRIARLPGAMQLSLVKSAAPGQGTLTLRFSVNPLALVGVTILDRNGQTTSFDLSDFQPGAEIDPARFEYHAPKTSEQ